jgi:hypothetical protein
MSVVFASLGRYESDGTMTTVGKGTMLLIEIPLLDQNSGG